MRGQRHAPAALYPSQDPVSIIQEAGWATGPVWTGAENLAPTGIRSPDRPSHGQSLYRLRYPYTMIGCNYIFSPPNSFTDFVSDISSKIQSSSCSITWNWGTNLGYQTLLTVVIKQSGFRLQRKGGFFFLVLS